MRPLSGLLALVIAGSFLLWLPLRSRPQVPATAPTRAAERLSLLIVFGDQRQGEKTYDGSLRVNGGRLLALENWRFLQGDALAGENSWKLHIHRIAFENQPDAPNTIPTASVPQNLVPAGVMATIEPSATSIDVATAQGSFQIPVNRLDYGKPLRYLNDDVVVQRVPSAAQVSTENREEHDYPSLAVTKSGTVWFAWQAYQDRGDRVYVAPLDGPAVAITEGKADIFRTAIAADSQGRLHVAWSERNGEDWHLWERTLEGGRWTARRQITHEHSPNIFHKLVASPDGRLRLIWVGYEAGRSYLYLSEWDGAAWSGPRLIGGPSVWSPDAAAGARGDFFVAWDSYQNGNYDIFFRGVKSDGSLAPVEQVTTSPKFQAHPSLAVDNLQRPWLAFDESGTNWGKDWTHTDPYRAPVLYQNRAVRVVVKEGGTWKEAPDFSAAVPDRLRRYAQLPHLTVDGSGRLWALFQMRSSSSNNRQDFWTAGGLWDLYLTTTTAVSCAG
jgi:hypothetical protein